MFTTWLRKRLNQPIIDELETQRRALATSIMHPPPEHPLGHPHTLGLYDGINRALSLLEGEGR